MFHSQSWTGCAEQELHGQHYGHSDGKMAVERFVAEQLHGEYAAERAPGRRPAEQHALGDTPAAAAGEMLIPSHKKKRDGTHEKQPAHIVFQHQDHPFGGGI